MDTVFDRLIPIDLIIGLNETKSLYLLFNYGVKLRSKLALRSSNGKRSELRKSQRQKPKRTSKNLEMITTSKCVLQLITTTTSILRQNKDFRRCDFTYGIKKDHNVENHKYLFKQLPMAYYLWIPRPVGPWGVWLGSIRLGQAELGQVKFHYIKLGQIRLG